MTRGVGAIRCDDCRRTFRGTVGFDLHRTASGRCRSAKELHRLRLRRREDGTWVQTKPLHRYPRPRQLRLFHPGRPWKAENWPARRLVREALEWLKKRTGTKNNGRQGTADEPRSTSSPPAGLFSGEPARPGPMAPSDTPPESGAELVAAPLPGAPPPRPAGLPEKLADVLDFERAWGDRPPRLKTRAIRDRFGVSAIVYSSRLNQALDHPLAPTYDGILVARLRRRRSELVAKRFHRSPAGSESGSRSFLPADPIAEGGAS